MASVSGLDIDGIEGAEVIGRGGSAVVYRARQPDLDRWVAVKVLATRSEAGRKRFDRERRAMGRLSQHPGIVTIFESGVSGSGRPYLMMPYFERGSLEEHLSEHGPVAADEAGRLMATVSRTVADAHDRRVLHRDLKPANVLLRDDGMPLVSDFGMARLVDQPTLSTAVGHTPAFSAPEIVTGQPASEASDVYSLGATLFALLAGHAPFTREGQRVSLGELAERITLEPVAVERPDGIPDEVWAVVELAMAKSPSDRPSSARVLADRLDGARGMAPAVVSPPGRSRRVLAGIGVVALVVVLAGVAMAGLWRGGSGEDVGSATTVVTAVASTVLSVATTTAAETTTSAEPTTTRIPISEEERVSLRVGGVPQTPLLVDEKVWVVRNEAEDQGALIRIDPETAAIEETIPLGLHPHGLTQVGDELWVNNVGDGTLSIVNLVDRDEPTAVIDVGVELQPELPFSSATVDPHQMLVAQGVVWVPDPAGGAIVRVDPVLRELLSSTDVGIRTSSPMEFGDSIWVGAQGLCGSRPCAQLRRLDPETGRVVDTVGFGEAVLDVGTPGGGVEGLWAPLSNGVLAKIDPDTGEPIASIEFGGTVGTPVSAGDEMWIGLDSAGQLACVSDSGCASDRVDIGRSVTVPVAVDGLVYAGDPTGGVLYGIDPADGSVSREIPADLLLQPPLIASPYVWLSTVGQVTRVLFADTA